MERNLRLYPFYRGSRAALFWVPVFFLYFSSRVTVDQVLLLESIYYLSVVTLEVPSGYFSDRIGRKPTLVLSALAGVASYSLFYFGGQLEGPFLAFAGAQFLFAICKSFNSGTDSSLLFDTLLALDRKDELLKLESKTQAVSYVVAAAAAVVGGAIGMYGLGLPYALSAVGALGALVAALMFVEPPLEKRIAVNPMNALKAVISHIKTPILGWVFVAAVSVTVFHHVPYEFIQPYLELLFGGKGDQTPMVSGLLYGFTMGLAAVASWLLGRTKRKVGPSFLIVSLAACALLIGLLASGLSWWVVPLLALRGLPGAIATPVIAATVHPRIPSGIRASYFSVQSLVGRLTFAITLALASLGFGEDHTPEYSDLRAVLLYFLAANALIVAGLFLTKARTKNT